LRTSWRTRERRTATSEKEFGGGEKKPSFERDERENADQADGEHSWYTVPLTLL